MARDVTPFLTFTGQGQEALALYLEVFADAEVLSLEPYGPDEEGIEGTLRRATLRLGEGRLVMIDTPARAGFNFTSAMSLLVTTDSAAEVDTAAAALSEGGATLMPPDTYDFADRFAWISDRFGVSWQLAFGFRV